ncbi:MAG: hypothetical protein IJX78_01190 [Bacilli bacterium]|nr:hypothetical protein [Bacilli bacterium]
MKKERLKELKDKLNKKIESKSSRKTSRFSRLKKEYKNKDLKENNNLKIIGITGSRGKSTVAYMVHEYLKLLGKKCVLYSSLGVDSPASIMKSNEAIELAVSSTESLLSILDEVEMYEADYLVLEINESTIDLVKEVPFDVKVLTNFNPKHNDEQYSDEEYKNLKQSFFKNDNNSICVMGVGSMMSKEDFLEFMSLNNNPKVTFGSKHICEVREIDYNKINFLLHELDSSLDGLSMEVFINGENKHFRTNTILCHNALNYVTAMATLYALGEFEVNKFNKCIKDMMIPGREEVLFVNGRTIVIGLFLNPALENFVTYKKNHEIKNIKVLTGSVGSGFKTWKEKYKDEKFINNRSASRKFAMEQIDKYADYVYLTENDNAKEDVLDICLELQSYLPNTKNKIVTDRETAIREMIKESVDGDLLFISGRGNKRVLCYAEDKCKLLKDKDIVETVLKELGW